ncbi:MAG: DUF4345 domain-containing protein [Flaviramulus sp.]|nr:DUF4345 domain-containing protein [Flaviramulus sp.]
MDKQQIINKSHLIVSVLVVVCIAFIYGFYPEKLFDINLKSTDEHNIFKATMGMYLGFSTLWILGIFKPKYFKPALISNVIFMLGLGFGRLLSLFLDGIPTFLFVLGTVGELFLGFYSIWVLKRLNQTKFS